MQGIPTKNYNYPSESRAYVGLKGLELRALRVLGLGFKTLSSPKP